MTEGLEQIAMPIPVAAKLLGVSTRTIRNYISRGHLPAIRIGTKPLVIKKGLDLLIASSGVELQYFQEDVQRRVAEEQALEAIKAQERGARALERKARTQARLMKAAERRAAKARQRAEEAQARAAAELERAEAIMSAALAKVARD